jgi:hypothetical protein
MANKHHKKELVQMPEVQQFLKDKAKEKRKKSTKSSIQMPEKPATPSASIKKIDL